MKSVTTYLTFDRNCRQAMTFYQQCLGGDLQMTTFPGAKGQPSTDPNAGIMHARISKGGQPLLMASEAPEDRPQPGTNFSVSIDCDSLAEIDRLFAAFSQNGKVRLPVSDVPWGARFGMLTDQFGIQWMFNCDMPK
jgi:PhnB protein